MRIYDVRIRFHISNNLIKIVAKRKDRVVKNFHKADVPDRVRKQVSEFEEK